MESFHLNCGAARQHRVDESNESLGFPATTRGQRETHILIRGPSGMPLLGQDAGFDDVFCGQEGKDVKDYGVGQFADVIHQVSGFILIGRR